MTRISYTDDAPAAYKAMLGLEQYVRGSGLEHSLLELVKARASQINGCAYCLDIAHKGSARCRRDGATAVPLASVA